MNWQIFSLIGYLSVALWCSVTLLWFAYWRRQQTWLRHLAIGLTITAFLCAEINSRNHINRIQAIPRGPLTELGSPQDSIRQAALEGRGKEVAQISFAEDAKGEFLDKAGMDEADLKYLGNAEKNAIPEWQRQKKSRSQGAVKDATPEEELSTQIDDTKDASGVDVKIADDTAKNPPPQMSEADLTTARRLDRLNLQIVRLVFIAGLLILAIDYLHRANNYTRASFPLPFPSSWLNSFNPMPPLVIRPQPPRRVISEELEWLAKRGDSFVYLTDNPTAASEAITHLKTRLMRRQSPQVLHVDDAISDEFIFESLWFGRGSFVVDSAARAQSIIDYFNDRLEQRRSTRAQVTQTVHLVWDMEIPVPESTRETFVKLAGVTGFSLQSS